MNNFIIQDDAGLGLRHLSYVNKVANTVIVKLYN